MPNAQEGTLRAIAWRPVDGDAMAEVDQCEVVPGRGITTENRKSGKREVTLLSVDSWRRACNELGAELPWHTRRANLLIEGIDLQGAVGHVLTIGDNVRIRIHGETKPCQIMDQQHVGLKNALVPEFRGGVFGEVSSGGRLAVGDRVTIA